MTHLEQTTPTAQTVIMPETTIIGKITGVGDLLVKGKVEGEIDLKSTVTIDGTGRSDATLKAQNIILSGSQNGDTQALDSIVLTPSGVVKSNLKAPVISIEKGAKFSGAIEMTQL